MFTYENWTPLPLMIWTLGPIEARWYPRALPSLVQILNLTCFQLDYPEQNLNQNIICFLSTKYIWKFHLENVLIFCLGPCMLIFLRQSLFEVFPLLECNLFGSTADHKILLNLMKNKFLNKNPLIPLVLKLDKHSGTTRSPISWLLNPGSLHHQSCYNQHHCLFYG